jgi:hypothetical protein
MTIFRKVLTPFEELVFRCACKGVGTFRLRSTDEEIEKTKEAFYEMSQGRREDLRRILLDKITH